MPLNEEGFITRVSLRHSVSPDAVRTILRALRSGGGTMAQFSHSDFGGMSQWSPGMTMVGDMFNNSLKAKLDALCIELATYVAETPPSTDRGREGDDVSYRSSRQVRLVAGESRNARAQLAHRMTFSMRFSPALDDWQSKTANVLIFSTAAAIESLVWPKPKAQTKR
jgi:hypothetical protein